MDMNTFLTATPATCKQVPASGLSLAGRLMRHRPIHFGGYPVTDPATGFGTKAGAH